MQKLHVLSCVLSLVQLTDHGRDAYFKVSTINRYPLWK
jgi:hypothetical protein